MYGNDPNHAAPQVSSALTEILGCLAVAISFRPLILPTMTVAFRVSLAFVFASIFASAVFAADDETKTDNGLISPAGETDLSEFIWKKRPILVFADSADDPKFIEQIALLEKRADALLSRDVVVLTDTDPKTLSDVRKKLRPRGFMLVIMSKEGRVQLRKPFPWDVREISRTIDKLPIRQREIREGTGGS